MLSKVIKFAYSPSLKLFYKKCLYSKLKTSREKSHSVQFTTRWNRAVTEKPKSTTYDSIVWFEILLLRSCLALSKLHLSKEPDLLGFENLVGLRLLRNAILL